MNKRELKNLRKSCDTWMQGYKSKGGKVASWFCGHCKKDNETPKPKKSDVSESKGCWDSATTCIYCGKCSLVAVWPNGKTASRAMHDVKIKTIKVKDLTIGTR